MALEAARAVAEDAVREEQAARKLEEIAADIQAEADAEGIV